MIRVRRLGDLAVARYSSSTPRCLACNKTGDPWTAIPQQIPVVPIPFEHGLTHFAQSVNRGRPKIVAIGSSSTVGHGNIKPYPERLLPFLQAQYPNAKITMVDHGNRQAGSADRVSAVRYRRHRREARSGDLAGGNNTVSAKPGLRILHLRPSTKPPAPSAMASSNCATRRRPTSS